MLGWLSHSSIPSRLKFAISLPDSEAWRADFLGAFLLLTEERNWEEFGSLSPEEMADEWRAIFFNFVVDQEVCMPVGGIMAFGGSVAPDGWFICDGAAFDRSDFANLFDVIGVTYGIGNGTTTANLPDLRGNVPVGRHSGLDYASDLGVVGGEHEHSLVLGEMPSHNHTQDSHNHTQNSHTHTIFGALVGAVGSGTVVLQGSSAGANQTSQGTVATNQAQTATNQAVGGGGVHNNLQPYLVVNYIIKY